ncbi:MAG TPA: hypothetical protein VGF67_07865 [Ktedonobacteraceae bacterium]|jgi:uncharacterized membrane protein YeaQ/YmgE (transglycosylase-associated protein family)
MTLVLLSDPVLYSFTLSHLLYLIIAIIIGILAETIIGWRLPYGVLGAILCATLGIILVLLLPINVGGEVQLFGQSIAVARAFVGGAVLVTIWHLVTYTSWRSRHRYYRGRRENYRRR